VDLELTLAGLGGLIVCALGYLVLQVIGDVAADEAKEAVFRRPAWVRRRRRHRFLMKSGWLCAILSAAAALVWVAIATNGRPDNGEDARLFATLTVLLAGLAVGQLIAWWHLAGKPHR
jgi:hypothetical protein